MSSDRGATVMSENSSSTFSFMKVGICVGNEDRIILTCDENYENIVGRSREKIIGKRVEDITHPSDVNSNTWLLKAAIDCRRAFDIRKRYVIPDGSYRWVENRVSIMPSEAGELAVAVSRPIPAPIAGSLNVQSDLREYLADMAGQLAEMAREAGLIGAADSLSAGAALSRIEGRG